MASTPNLTHAPIDAATQLTNASSVSVPATLYTAPTTGESTGGAKVGFFRATSTDTTQAINLLIYKTISGIDYLLGYVAVPMAASAATPATVDILAALWGGLACNVGPGVVLKVMPAVAPASGKIVNVTVEGATF